jgi:4-hydroxy-tetrahydrodipicolinate synthase
MEKRKTKWKGVFTAIVTPFLPSGEIDWKSYRELLKAQKAARVAGVIPCGTTGESPTLTKEEKKKLITVTLEELKGSGLKVMAGTGSNSTAETIELSSWASDQGVDGVLVVVPYYNKPSQTGLISHFTQVADRVKCDVVLYNVPSRTVAALTAETVAELACHPRIAAIKEATGNLAFDSEIIEALRLEKTELALLSGDDLTFLPFLALGGDGVISVASNLIPAELVELHTQFEKGNLARARELHEKYFQVFKDLFFEPSPAPAKYALSLTGICSTAVRSPITELSDAGVERLNATLKRAGLLERK